MTQPGGRRSHLPCSAPRGGGPERAAPSHSGPATWEDGGRRLRQAMTDSRTETDCMGPSRSRPTATGAPRRSARCTTSRSATRDDRMPTEVIRALALLKKAAALVNADLGLLDRHAGRPDRRGRRRGHRRQPRRPLPAARLADRHRHADEHERQRGHLEPRHRARRRRARLARSRSTPTTTSTCRSRRTTRSRPRCTSPPPSSSSTASCPPSARSATRSTRRPPSSPTS